MGAGDRARVSSPPSSSEFGELLDLKTRPVLSDWVLNLSDDMNRKFWMGSKHFGQEKRFSPTMFSDAVKQPEHIACSQVDSKTPFLAEDEHETHETRTGSCEVVDDLVFFEEKSGAGATNSPLLPEGVPASWEHERRVCVFEGVMR
jgi:hypothetical protein